MDLNLKMAEYFNMNEDDRDNFVIEMANFYYERWVNTENESIFHFTINELLFRLEMEHRLAIKTENYERADVYYKLCRIFHKIKDEQTF